MCTPLTCLEPHFFYSESNRAHVPQTAVQPLPVVEDLDVIEQIVFYCIYCIILLSEKELFFKLAKKLSIGLLS